MRSSPGASEFWLIPADTPKIAPGQMRSTQFRRYVKGRLGALSSLELSNLSVSIGSVAAAGKRILRVCFREITPDSLRQT